MGTDTEYNSKSLWNIYPSIPEIYKWLHEIETLPIQDAIYTAQKYDCTSDRAKWTIHTTKSTNFINELISGSQDIQKWS